MFTETSFEDWYAEVKTAFTKAGLALPEDIEMMELVHMECMAEHKSIAILCRKQQQSKMGNS